MEAERPERVVDPRELARRQRRDGLRPEPTDHGLADVPSVGGRFDDPSDAAGPNRLAEPDLHVEPLAAQHRARAGIDRDELDGDADLSGFERVEFDIADFEAVGRRLTGRTTDEGDTTGGGHRPIVARHLSAGRPEARDDPVQLTGWSRFPGATSGQTPELVQQLVGQAVDPMVELARHRSVAEVASGDTEHAGAEQACSAAVGPVRSRRPRPPRASTRRPPTATSRRDRSHGARRPGRGRRRHRRSRHRRRPPTAAGARRGRPHARA